MREGVGPLRKRRCAPGALRLPDAYAAQRQQLRDLLGGTVDAGVYYRQALLDVRGGGPMAQDLPLNVAAWALAGAWQGMEVYGLYGATAVTGPNREDGGSQALDSHLAQQVRAVSMLIPGRAGLQVWAPGRVSPVAARHPAFFVWSGSACAGGGGPFGQKDLGADLLRVWPTCDFVRIESIVAPQPSRPTCMPVSHSTRSAATAPSGRASLTRRSRGESRTRRSRSCQTPSKGLHPKDFDGLFGGSGRRAGSG
jgi:hypothetical protein